MTYETDIEKRKLAIWGSSAGKSAIADKLAAMLPSHRVYVEPFVGSGAVLFAKEPAEVEVVNDYDEEIAEAFQAIKNMTPEKLKALERKNWKNSREHWTRLKENKPSDELGRLHRFMFLARFSYGNMRGKSWDPGSNGQVYSGAVKRIERHMARCKKLHIYSGDYEKVVRKYDSPDTVFFFDPPYFGYDARVRENKFDEQHFYEVLKSIKGKWLLTYGELPGLLRKGGYNVRTFRTYRSIATMRGVKPTKVLSQIWVANYKVGNATKALAKAERRSLRVSNPAHLVERLTAGQPAGVLSAIDRSTFVDQELVLVNDIQKDDAAQQAFGVVVMKSGVRFESGAKAVQALGEKIDTFMADTYRNDPEPVWFVPLRLQTRFDPPREIVKGQPLPSVPSPEPKAYDDRDAFLAEFEKEDVLAGGVVVEPMLAGKKVIVARDTSGKAFVTFNGREDQSASYPGIAEAVAKLSDACLMVGMWVPHDEAGNPMPVDKAVWSTAFINDLPDSAFLHIEAGGKKDEDGKTVPRSLRHFPVRNQDGDLDVPHLRNAISRAPQAKLPKEVIERVQAEARRLLEEVQKAERPRRRADHPQGRVFIYDALLWGKEDLTKRPWTERKAVRDRALGQRGIGPLVNTPGRVVYSRDALSGALSWASKQPASEGAVGKQANGQYVHGGRFATLKTTRVINALVVGASKQEGGTVYECAVGPLAENEAGLWKNTTNYDGRLFTKLGPTLPTKVQASNGDVLRVDVSELLVIDSDKGRAITWGSPVVAERVRVRPDAVTDVRSKASPNEIVRKTEVAVLKADEEERYVLGVVLEPNDGKDGAPLEPDAHRDVYSVDDVRKAALRFLVEYNKLGVMHQRIAKRAEMVVCENYVAPADFTVNGQNVRKGSWLLGAFILSDDMWQQVKDGKLNAWSIQGKAMSRPEVVR